MTIKDIAKMAGVSTATVSRVIHDYKWVSEDVRKRVMEVIEKENYCPNYNAGVMATGKSKMIVVVVPDIMSPFFAQFTSIVTKTFKRSGYATMLYQTDNDADEEAEFFSSPYARMADAIISVTDGVENDLLLKIIKPLRDKNMPVLFIDRYLPDNIADCVINDNIGAMRKAVELLYRNGHRRIALITGEKGLTVVHDKMTGYRNALKALKLPLNENYIRTGSWSAETGRIEMEKLLKMRVPPTAVIACNNYLCEGAFETIENFGLTVGKDFSLIGFEESSSDARLFSQLGVTTLKLDSEKLAHYASRYILTKLKHNEAQSYCTKTEYVVDLIERNSVVDLNQTP